MVGKPTIVTVSIQLAEVITTQHDMKTRLFGGNGELGIIHYLVETDKSNAAAVQELKDLVLAQKAATDLSCQGCRASIVSEVATVKAEVTAGILAAKTEAASQCLASKTETTAGILAAKVEAEKNIEAIRTVGKVRHAYIAGLAAAAGVVGAGFVKVIPMLAVLFKSSK
jgi:hypothetical protein